MIMLKPSLFAEEERGNRRSKLGDPLVGLSKHVDFAALADKIDTALPRPSRAKGGRPPYPTVLMTKILILLQLYNLADDVLEYQVLDRRSFLQLLGLTKSSTIPDAKTIWLFATAWHRRVWAPGCSTRCSNSCWHTAIWRVAARSSTRRRCRRRLTVVC